MTRIMPEGRTCAPPRLRQRAMGGSPLPSVARQEVVQLSQLDADIVALMDKLSTR
ncbi:MAG: hypothetical protein ACLTKG_01880 [Collinsella intestinalis]